MQNAAETGVATATEKRKAMRGFHNGIAIFRSVYRRQMTWAGGVPHRRYVVEGGVPTSMAISYPEVQFEDYTFRTDRPDVAGPLIDNKNFEPGGLWGWNLDPTCLTKDMRSIYTKVRRDVRQAMALELVAGTPSTEVLAKFEKAGKLVFGSDPAVDGGIPHEIPCPATNCIAIFREIGPEKVKKCLEQLNAHIQAQHPNWSNKA